MDPSFGYVFPAIRGVQAGREYYVSMCPLRLIPRIFSFDEEELAPEHRAQRVLNKGRIPEMARYIMANPSEYVFSSLTASIDADVDFEPLGSAAEGSHVGKLHIPMGARFVINDGQHRRAAIEAALRERPELADETISVVFFLDIGLKRCQQMFADLNRYAIRPSTSLGLLYDHRDGLALVAKQLVFHSQLFRGVVELERATLSVRSRKLFTLSAIHTGTKALLAGRKDHTVEEASALALEFWEGVAEQIPEWSLVSEGKMTAAEVRREYIHSHGIVLHALGHAGASLLRRVPKGWRKRLPALAKLDWRRGNVAQWEGRAMVGGRVSKSRQNVILTTNVLKQAFGLALSTAEQQAEDAFLRGNDE